uniref:Uncharacterized protein n=1 Tax=Malurus cyaneus samueli TaxID=2593467 RepID=A0A8C5T3C0_9PASS
MSCWVGPAGSSPGSRGRRERGCKWDRRKYLSVTAVSGAFLSALAAGPWHCPMPVPSPGQVDIGKAEFCMCCQGVEGEGSSGKGMGCQGVEGEGSSGKGMGCQGVESEGSSGKGVGCQGVEGEGSSGKGMGCQRVEGEGSSGKGVGCQGVEGEGSSPSTTVIPILPELGRQVGFGPDPTGSICAGWMLW